MRNTCGLLAAVLSLFVSVAALPGVAGADPPTWQVVPSPNPTGSLWTQLGSVTCVSLSDCTALGYWLSPGGDETLVETWDGHVVADRSVAEPCRLGFGRTCIGVVYRPVRLLLGKRHDDPLLRP